MPGPLPIGSPWQGSFPKVSSFDNQKSWHAYVHIPFCEVRCGYCDFNTYTADEVQGIKRAEFDESLALEVSKAATQLHNSEIQAKPFSTVFFGGGTPSLFNHAQIKNVIDQLRDDFGFTEDAEFTMEVNPDTVDENYLQSISQLGITRVSIGAQSFDSDVLKVLDRTHNPENVENAVFGAKKAGLQVSLDLIYGAPGESLESWRGTLEKALSMDPDHLSAYALIIEQGTKLARQISKGVYPEPDDDLMAEKYELLDLMTSQRGLSWYELSNFSKNQQTQSRHNRAYWMSNYWYGFGPGAHSFIGNIRFWNRKHPAAYAESLRKDLPVQGYELIQPNEHLQERLLLEIRLAEGIEKSLLSELGVTEEVIAEQQQYGYLENQSNWFSLTLKGRQMADRVVLNLLN
ncbi:MAG: radical SAM family heme chaperone HemW [Microbacteriaceae bacterium]|nr:radical SAM family heme chaperone HemW [Microbacteriaceae bacterium]MDR9443588.1 radical SAM family heme chaperone HemW [Microbacteriaceae bacterium]